MLFNLITTTLLKIIGANKVMGSYKVLSHKFDQNQRELILLDKGHKIR